LYTVQRGDSLGKISRITGVSVQTLIDLNKATYPSLPGNPDLIYTGWVLKLV
jgi:LysM repeat protein